MSFLRLEKQERRQFLTLLAASLVYVLPVLLADRLYNDDVPRAIYGATGWDGDGRPLVTLLLTFLCGGGDTVVNLFPLPLILALVVLSYALILYAKRNLPDCMDRLLLAPVLLLVLTNPFAMTNLSYQFDSLSMFLALSIALFLYALPQTLAGPLLALAGAAAGLAIMASYQAAAGMLLVLAAIELFFWLVERRRGVLQRELWRLGGVAAGALFYLAVLAPRLVPTDDWRHEASKTISGLEGIKTLLLNIIRGAYKIRESMRLAPQLYRAALLLFLLAAVGGFLYRYLRTVPAGTSPGRRLLCCGVILIAPGVTMAASYLPLAFLQTMDLAPRVFLSLGGSTMFVGILLLRAFPAGHLPRLRQAFGLVLAVCLLFQYSYMAAFGSAMKAQKEYETYLATSIAHDVNLINADHSYHTLSFAGGAPVSVETQMIEKKFPFVREILPVYFTNTSWGGASWMYRFTQYELEITALTDSDCIAVTGTPMLCTARYYCYVNGDKILVQFQ